MKRRSYLIHRTFRQFIAANILAAVALYAGFIVDGIIVGNLLGPTSLAALNLCSPVIQMLFAISTLINVGGSIWASVLIGRGEKEKVQHVFSTAMLLNLLCGLGLILVGVFSMDALVHFLCKAEKLRPLVKEYLTITLYCAPIPIFSLGLASFLRIDSAPKRVMGALIAANVVNLCLDYSLIKFFGVKIQASPIALNTGFAVSLAMMMFHFLSRKRSLAFRRLLPWREWGKILWTGFPLAVSSLMTVALFIFINRTIASTAGVLGITILSICMNLLLFSSLFISGVLQTMQPICGVMFGSKDMSGLRMGVRIALIFLMACLVPTTIYLECCPFQSALLFGIRDITHQNHIETAIRIFSLCLPLSGIVALYSVGYLSVGKKKISLMLSVLQPLLLMGIMSLGKSWGESYVWSSFALSYLLTLIVLFCLRVPLIPRLKDVFILIDGSLSRPTQKTPTQNSKDFWRHFRRKRSFLEQTQKPKPLSIDPKNATKPLATISNAREIAQISDELRNILETRTTKTLAQTFHSTIMAAINDNPQWRHLDLILIEEKLLFSAILRDDSPYDPEREWVLGQNVTTIRQPILPAEPF